jgi:26S proteasome regulatory subunit N2
MHAGTTVDTFLRENLVCNSLIMSRTFFSCSDRILLTLSVLQEWLGRATNWAKFSATAGLGVIHRGHLQQSRALMTPYLPPDGGAVGSASPYSEGGALYALGLIHANHGEGIKQFLRESLRNTSNEVLF